MTSRMELPTSERVYKQQHNLEQHTASLIRRRLLALARIAFGLAWAVAAWLKWQPAFLHGLPTLLQGAMDGQPVLVARWIGFWFHIVQGQPLLFAYLIASIESLLAVCFLFGIGTNIASVVGCLYALGLWSVAEGFGGPYVAGQSTDIGTAFPYAILCLVMACVGAGRYYGLDGLLALRRVQVKSRMIEQHYRRY